MNDKWFEMFESEVEQHKKSMKQYKRELLLCYVILALTVSVVIVGFLSELK